MFYPPHYSVFLVKKVTSYFLKKNLSLHLRQLLMKCYYSDILERFFSFTRGHKTPLPEITSFLNLLSHYVERNSLLFFLKFNKINKYIRKYSRGKSGKYQAKIAYVLPKSRFKITLKLIIKEIQSKPLRTVKGKFNALLKIVFLNKNLPALVKFKSYIGFLVLDRRLYV